PSPPSYHFFINTPALTNIYTLSLHDALPISQGLRPGPVCACQRDDRLRWPRGLALRALAVSMQSEAPLTLILSPLRAGRGKLECTFLGSLFGVSPKRRGGRFHSLNGVTR